jgi:hypothetical protein
MVAHSLFPLKLETNAHTETVDVNIGVDPADESGAFEIDLETTVAEQKMSARQPLRYKLNSISLDYLNSTVLNVSSSSVSP